MGSQDVLSGAMRESIRPPYQGVKNLLIDLDGTIVGANELSLAADFVFKAIRTARKFGGTRKAIRALHEVRKALEGKPAPGQEGKTNSSKAIEAFANVLGMGIDQAEGILVSSTKVIFPTLGRHFYPMPGALDFLNWAKERYPLILATNPVWPRDVVEMRVRWAGVDPAIFKRITLAREMSASKPWLTYYSEILEQEKLKPMDCLLIGNDLKKDLPAVKVGIPVFIVNPTDRRLKKIPVASGVEAYRGRFDHLKRLLEAHE